MPSYLNTLWQLQELKCQDKDRLSFEDFQNFLVGQAPRSSKALVDGLQKAGSLRRFSSACLREQSQKSIGSDLGGCINSSHLTSSRILASALSLRNVSVSDRNSASQRSGSSGALLTSSRRRSLQVDSPE